MASSSTSLLKAPVVTFYENNVSVLDVCVDVWLLKKKRIHFVMDQGSHLYFLEVSFVLAMLLVKYKIIVIRTEGVL